MKLKTTKAFTLIELLVVITIIGILATGATATFTSQMTKARDASRESTSKAIESAVEQAYMEKQEYPKADMSADWYDLIMSYMKDAPKDPKTNKVFSGEASAYIYGTWTDADGGDYQAFEISYVLEDKDNREAKAIDTVDLGNNNSRVELGNNRTGISTTKTVATGKDATGTGFVDGAFLIFQ